MPIDNVSNRNSVPSTPIESQEVVRTTRENERETSEHIEAESNESTAPSESAAKEARSRMLEGQLKGKTMQAELQSQLQSTRSPEQSELHKARIQEKLDQVEQKIDHAMIARDKITSHLPRLKDEIERTQSEIQDLNNEAKQLKEDASKLSEGERERGLKSADHPLGQRAFELAKKRDELNRKLDNLINESADLYGGAIPGSPSLNTSALRNASLETKLRGLEDINRHLKDLLHGTGNNTIQVKIGDTTVTAKGLDDYIAKLQKLHTNLQAEERN